MAGIFKCIAMLLILTMKNVFGQAQYWEQHWTFPAGVASAMIPHPDMSSADSTSDKFECPGAGRYALKNPKKGNCGKYYECPGMGYKPVTIQECPGELKFNRLSKTCLEKDFVKCKWCIREGRHEDITSTGHFIECVPGSVAYRYKCKNGNYDAKKRECKEKSWKVMDITMDAELDMPTDILQFQKDWNQEKKDDKEVGRSIEVRENMDENSEDKTKTTSNTDSEKKKDDHSETDSETKRKKDKKHESSDK